MTAGKVLGTVRRRLFAGLVVRHAFVAVAALSGLVLALFLMDAIADLPERLRAATPVLLGTVAALVVALLIVRLHALRERRVARMLEQRDATLGNRLTNAVELAETKQPTDVGEYLRLAAVELGAHAAAQVRVWPFIRRGLLMVAALLVAVAGCWVALVAGAPGIYRAVLPRFIDPHGDHPPFSDLKLEVTPRIADVLYGGQLEVRASASGRPVEKLWVVTRSGTNLQRMVMFLAPDRSFFQTLVNLREPGQFHVTDGRARSHWHPIKLRYTPQVTLVELETTFPAYTRKETRTTKLAEKIQPMPEGTRIRFRVASNRPLRDGTLMVTPLLGGLPQGIPLVVQGQSNMVAGELMLEKSSAFSLAIRDVDGLAALDTPQGRLEVLPDERPRLVVLEPGRNAVGTPSIKVPVRVQAQDDYGVERVMWLRGHNRSIERPFAMKMELKNGPASVEAAGAFDLEKLGVLPGDVIDYYFEAADNFPKGPNIALSRMFRLEVISKEAYEQVLRSAAARKALFEPYFKLGAWLKRLAERARKLQDTAESGTPQEKAGLVKESAALAAEIDKLRSELGKLQEQAIMFDVEQAFRKALVQQDAALSQLSKNLKQQAASGSPGASDLRSIARALTKMSEQEQEDISVPAQHVAAVSRLIAKADVFTKLAKEEDVIARMLRRFSEQKTPLTRAEQIEVQEFTHQQRRIHSELQEWLSSLTELMEQVPADKQYDPLRTDVNKFMQAVRDAGIESDISSSAKALGEMDAMTGQVLAQNAAEKMAKLIKQCDGLGDTAAECLRFQPKLASSLGNTLQQILSAMRGQGSGGGQGQDGYSLFNEDVALYGPGMQLAGEHARGGEAPGGRAQAGERLAGTPSDPGIDAPREPGRVRLQPNAKFPLRYRELVGEYFKAIADTETDGGQK